MRGVKRNAKWKEIGAKGEEAMKVSGFMYRLGHVAGQIPAFGIEEEWRGSKVGGAIGLGILSIRRRGRGREQWGK